MRILLAEDDAVARLFLETALVEWGYEVVTTSDGLEAWQALEAADTPRLAILDWVMPGLDGLEICRRARARPQAPPLYIIMLTARDRPADVVEGLSTGANDYVTKSFDYPELRARAQVGAEMARLQDELARRVRQLEDALVHVKRLQGIMPICSYCKKIRDDRDYWHQVESYITAHSDALFSHSICPDCFRREIEPELGPMEDSA